MFVGLMFIVLGSLVFGFGFTYDGANLAAGTATLIIGLVVIAASARSLSKAKKQRIAEENKIRYEPPMTKPEPAKRRYSPPPPPTGQQEEEVEYVVECPNCGRHNAETAKYCSNCGSDLGE